MSKLIFISAVSIFLASCNASRQVQSTSKESVATLPEKKTGIESSSRNDKADYISSSKKLQNEYAVKLGVSTREISNLSLYTFIDEWMNTPYKYSGKSKSGVDCSGFTSILLKEVYEKSVSGSSLSIYSLCKPVEKNDLKEGDLVFFKINGKEISHVGVYLLNNKFVHASTQAGVIISDLDEAYYKKYFFKGGRLK